MITAILIIITLCGKFPKLENFLSWFRALELLILFIIWQIIERQSLIGMIIFTSIFGIFGLSIINFLIKNRRKIV
jgi:hypothetical protein